MVSRNNTEKSSTGPNQPHSQEVEHPTIDWKNTFEVTFDSTKQYPLDIPIPNPSYTSSPDIPHQDSSFSTLHLDQSLLGNSLKMHLSFDLEMIKNHEPCYLNLQG